MKLRKWWLVTVVGCLFLLCGCTLKPQTPQTEPLSSGEQTEPLPYGEPIIQMMGEDDLCAVAYAGYHATEELLPYIETYLDGVYPATCYCSDGEAWLVIPRPGVSVQLYRNDFETHPEQSSINRELIYEDPSGKPLIVRCNASDIFPDATLVLTFEGKTVELTPYISLRDGSIQIGQSVYLLNP